MNLQQALKLQTTAQSALQDAQLQLQKAHKLMLEANNAYLHLARLAQFRAEADENGAEQPQILEVIALADEAQQDVIRQIQARYKGKIYYILPYDLIQDLIGDDTVRATQLQLMFNLAEAKITFNNIHPMFTLTRGLKIFKGN